MRRLLLLFIAGLALAAAKPAPLTMAFNPPKSFAMSKPTIRITLHIERSPDNRTLAWTCDSGDANYYSRAWTIDADHGPITFEDQRTMHHVPGGHYACAAELMRVDGTMRVVGSFDVLPDESQ